MSSSSRPADGQAEALGSAMPQARARLFMLASGFMVTQAIGAVVRLGIPELVSARQRSTAELADAVGADPLSLHRLLRALASVGVFAERNGVIAHTPMSELLCRGVPGSFAAQSLMFSEIQYRTWGEAFETFRTGEPAFARVYGSPLFEWLADHPVEAAIFTEAMAGGAAVRRTPLLSWDWSGVSTVVDVGGGSGVTLVSILAENPTLTGIVFDLHHVERDATDVIEGAGLGDRCRFVGGNFFDGVPAAADVYVLSAILHDWDDGPASSILRSVHDAMTPTSRVLVADSVIAAGNEQDNAKLVDLLMLVVLGGRERTEDEWRTLLARNGLTVVRAESGCIEAVRA
jgi:hypothetical protein